MANGIKTNSYSVPFHKDSGMILYLTHFPDHPVRIKARNGEFLNTDSLPTESVIVIIGTGISEWLLEQTETSQYFHAASHGVPSLEEDVSSRVIVARMKV